MYNNIDDNYEINDEIIKYAIYVGCEVGYEGRFRGLDGWSRVPSCAIVKTAERGCMHP